jgi:hypothetical protein
MSPRLKWILAVGAGLLIVGFILLIGPPGAVDVIGYHEVEPGVIELVLPCHNNITSEGVDECF